jgi:tRNA-modifying protein YgfZ
MNKCAIAQLPERGLVELKGPDAATFLQGLITNDVAKAKDGVAIFAGLLSPQGKILFEFFIAPAQDGYLLDCPASQAPDLVKRLSLYKLRAKIEIIDRSTTLAAAALWDAPAPPETLPPDGVLFPDPRLPGMGWRLIAPRQAFPEWVRSSDCRETAVSEYEAHRIRLTIPKGGVDYAFSDAYPHEACYDQLNGVDFKKGCYVGQEIVARMEFRKTARTRILRVDAAGGEPLPPPGAGLVADELPVGTLGSSVGARGLALIRLDRAIEARAKGCAITVNGVAVELSRPAWAQFAFAEPSN